jgi:serine/threonine protein kinase
MMTVGDAFVLDNATYTITEKVGQGGYSEVFRAVCDKPYRRPLAAKVLLPQYANDPVWRRRFEREARILANIRHPHVVRIRATGDLTDGSLTIFQDFVENATDMCAYFRTTEDAQRHLSIALQIFYGLREAHNSSGGARSIATFRHRMF